MVQVICLLCDHEQDVKQVCENCGVCMGDYYCEKCKFFDDEVGTTISVFLSCPLMLFNSLVIAWNHQKYFRGMPKTVWCFTIETLKMHQLKATDMLSGSRWCRLESSSITAIHVVYAELEAERISFIVIAVVNFLPCLNCKYNSNCIQNFDSMSIHRVPVTHIMLGSHELDFVVYVESVTNLGIAKVFDLDVHLWWYWIVVWADYGCTILAASCYTIALQNGHPCVEKSMHQNCPVCFEVNTCNRCLY